MANSYTFGEKQYRVGDMVAVNYKIKEGDKERLQLFKGILLKIKGDSAANRMITLRKITRSGIGVERIIPLSSPYIENMQLVKKSSYRKSKLYFVRNLSDQILKSKIYKSKKTSSAKKNESSAAKKGENR